MSNIAIRVENLYKEYRLGVLSHGTLYRDLQSWWANIRGKEDPNSPIGNSGQINNPNKKFWALQEVSFDVNEGDVIGIIGRNGAGKSTLLKIISRVTSPTKGMIKIKGRVASLLEVGTGFHPELTGRENVYLNGTILGMTKREIAKKFDEIVDFAEIERFIDTPVKRYSSGMYVRLAFAVAAHLEPEILVVDEVLAVGDVQFQKKCLGKMQDVSKKGRTVLFVSHNMAMIKQLCSKGLLIDEGRLITNSEILDVIETYLKKVNNDDLNVQEKFFPESSEKEFQILHISIIDKNGDLTRNFECDDPIFIKAKCISRIALRGLYGCMVVYNREDIPILVSDTFDVPPNSLDYLSPGIYEIKIKIPPRTLGHGEYKILFSFTSSQGIKDFWIDPPKFVCSFNLDDNSTERGNQRAGFLSTLLKWDIKKMD